MNNVQKMTEKIREAVELRRAGQAQEARQLLETCLIDDPSHAGANYQMAWTCDSLGLEKETAPYYEKAIANGLSGEELRGAMLGLGSTYRCLGLYEDSKRVLDQAVLKFPEDRAFRVFRALTMYNLGAADLAVGTLLIELLDTTSDASILLYKKALRFYADKLDETWI